jgi:predicted dehydrogenase
MADKIKVAIVGAGWAGRMAADAYWKLGETEVAVIVDSIGETAKKLASTYHCEWSSDYEKVLQRPEIAIVDICTPAFTHCEFAVKAAEAGKHVCVQKPMALSLADCDKIIKRAETNKVKLIVQEMTRFGQAYVKMHQFIDEGAVGLPEMTYWNQVITAEWAKGYPWNRDRKQSGGVLIDHNIHAYDLLRWNHGEVDRVYAEVAGLNPYLKESGIMEDHSAVVLKFKNGSLGIVQGSWSGTEATPIYRIQTIGTKGTFEIETLYPFESFTWKYSQAKGPATTSATNSVGFYERAAYFVDCIRRDTVITRGTGTDARKALEIGLAAIESAEKSMAIGLPPTRVGV